VSGGYRKGEDPMKTLLDELCIKLGCCLDPEEQVRMRRMPADDVDSFVKAFHVAEHLLEPYDEEHWRNVRYVVARHFALMRQTATSE